MKIIVLDHERSQADLICQTLTSAGHVCHGMRHGKDFFGQLHKDSCDMLILDWQVAGLAAADVVRRVRERLPANVPILFLAKLSGEDDIVAGLAAGADDYMIKPLRRGELLVRVQALLRRAYPAQHGTEQIQFGRYVFEIRLSRLLMDGTVLDVTHKEFHLALLFFRHIGRPLSRAYIHEAVWAHEAVVPSRTMDTHVSRVRNKLQLKLENGFRLAPVYSYGYRLEQVDA